MIVRPKTGPHPWRCDRCGEPPVLVGDPALDEFALSPCPGCLYALCIDCLIAHLTTGHAVCAATIEAARIHAAIRTVTPYSKDPDFFSPTFDGFEDDDWAFAHRACLNSLWAGPRC
jgi:hypothetical protein